MSMSVETDGVKVFASWHNHGMIDNRPRRRKRPRGFSQAAKLVVDIATGQVEDRPPRPEEQGTDPAA
jgi:hypothetical protein